MLEVLIVVTFLVLLSSLVYARPVEGPVVRKRTPRNGRYARTGYITVEIGTIHVAVPMRQVRKLQQYLPARSHDLSLWLQLPGAFVERAS